MCITREAEATFGRLLAQYKAVLVTGPCQVGKSTMIGLCQGETCGYVMLNDPIALYRATRDPVLFFQDHPLSLVIDEVQYAPELYRFLVAMAARTGQLLNMSDIANDADVDAKTVSRWLSLLEASGIVLRLQPYFTNAPKRVSKTPKLHFMDTGLAAHLLGWITPNVLARGAMAGALFESFVVGEIARSHMNGGRGADGLNFYHDTRKREIDPLIVEGRVVHPVGVKAGANPGRDDIGNFSALDALKGVEAGDGAVVCRAPRVYAIGERVKAVPIWAL